MQLSSLNTPTALTLIRLIFSPLFLPILLVYLIPFNSLFINLLLALCFILLSLTDFFDGYLARKYDQVTALGKALDPLADKFLLFSTLIALVAVQKLFFYIAILFIGREFFVMGLRMLALERGFDIPVSWFGKLKTVAQTIYITLVIIDGSLLIGKSIFIEYLFLIISLFLSLYSAYLYYRSFIKFYPI
ncbi:MAG: CDP-diacylglycerol--glycerol-3-phosphate 3-phosphatidyltransferase [Methanobacterium sp.]